MLLVSSDGWTKQKASWDVNVERIGGGIRPTKSGRCRWFILRVRHACSVFRKQASIDVSNVCVAFCNNECAVCCDLLELLGRATDVFLSENVKWF